MEDSISITKVPKTRTKLPIYIVSIIVIILVIAVLIINLLHRTNTHSELDGIASSSRPTTSHSEDHSSSSEEDEMEKENKITQTTIIQTSGTTPAEQGTTPSSYSTSVSPSPVSECDSMCSVSVVETIPRGIRFVDAVYTKNTFEAWKEMIGTAEREIDIFAFKMNLRGAQLRYDYDNSTFEGYQLYRILNKKAKEGVIVKLIEPSPSHGETRDADEMETLGLIQRQRLDMNTLNGGGGGVQHSTSFTVDDKHLFVGSMNLEWESLSQKLEIGLQFQNCACIAADSSRLFNSLFDSLSGRKTLEPVQFATHRIANSTFQFLASPSFLVETEESWDLANLLNVIYEADQFVDIAVMHYFPAWIYFKNQEFYSQIDNAIRMSISRGVKFRILVSGDSKENQRLMFTYLHSLHVLNVPTENRNIQVKYMMIPQSMHESYKERKLHAKFILSEKDTLIGSSNYAPEYFYKSSGTAVLIREEPNKGEINYQIKAVFDRYWHSSFSQSLEKFGESHGFLPRPSTPSNPFSGWFGFDRIGSINEKYSVSGFMDSDYSDDPIVIA